MWNLAMIVHLNEQWEREEKRRKEEKKRLLDASKRRAGYEYEKVESKKETPGSAW